MNALHLPGYRILDFKQNKYDYLYAIEPEEPPYVCIHCGSIDVKFTKHTVYRITEGYYQELVKHDKLGI